MHSKFYFTNMLPDKVYYLLVQFLIEMSLILTINENIFLISKLAKVKTYEGNTTYL